MRTTSRGLGTTSEGLGEGDALGLRFRADVAATEGEAEPNGWASLEGLPRGKPDSPSLKYMEVTLEWFGVIPNTRKKQVVTHLRNHRTSFFENNEQTTLWLQLNILCSVH